MDNFSTLNFNKSFLNTENQGLNSKSEVLKPRKQTIDFILNYSKALEINRNKKYIFFNISN